MKRIKNFEDAQKDIKGTPKKLTNKDFNEALFFLNNMHFPPNTKGFFRINVQDPVLAQAPAEPPYLAISVPAQDEVS
jgi:hypothetical protein